MKLKACWALSLGTQEVRFRRMKDSKVLHHTCGRSQIQSTKAGEVGHSLIVKTHGRAHREEIGGSEHSWRTESSEKLSYHLEPGRHWKHRWMSTGQFRAQVF